MSDTTPDPDLPERLDQHAPDPSTSSRSRRAPLLVGAAVAVLAVLGAGAWGVVSFLSGGGPAPATAIPSTAVAYVSIDLDPSASQKIEALKIAKKFPDLRKQLDLGNRDDLKRWIFGQIQKSDPCPSVSYDKDVKPWIGNRIGAAAVPEAGKLAPVVVVQVSDQDAARTGIEAMGNCDQGSGHLGIAFAGEYVVLSDTQAHADAAANAAKAHPLSEDATYKLWTGAVGDPGIVTMYASPKAPKAMLDAEQNMAGGDVGGFSSELPLTNQFSGLSKAYAGFKGMAAVVRFHDGAVEMESAAGGMTPLGTSGSAADVTELPASTGAAVAVGLPPRWGHHLVDRAKKTFGPNVDVDQMIAGLARETGLSVPDDVEKMLGSGVSVAMDGSADLSKPAPDTLPLGLRIVGDPSTVTPELDKLKVLLPPEVRLQTASGSGAVAVGMNPTYLATLAKSGSLGTDPTFTSVVPHADEASFVAYANFGAGGWLHRLVSQLSSDPKATADTAPLKAFGFSVWTDGGTSHALFRLSTN